MSQSRRPFPARADVRLLALAVVALFILGASAQAHRRHHAPPKFAGLQSAVTCIPGPIGPGRASSYTLSWEPASDEVTPASKIVYEVYQATTARGPGRREQDRATGREPVRVTPVSE